jgi:hypothetical protein
MYLPVEYNVKLQRKNGEERWKKSVWNMPPFIKQME